MRYLILPLALLLGACQPESSGSEAVAEAPPWVLATTLEPAAGTVWRLTGSVHARHEIPLAFRIGGAIVRRAVDAGERVEAGAVLFTLDPADVEQQRVAAEATVASARAETENAERERERLADMLERRLASQQEYDRAETAARAARERLVAAEASLEQARNAVGYATLRAPTSGVLIAVSGQPGQVVAAGEQIAVLAEDGAREAVVEVPEDRLEALPERAEARLLGVSAGLEAELRELAGAADAATRTWRARYRLIEGAAAPLGATVTLRFTSPLDAAAGLVARVPLGAVLERGRGAQVFRIDGEQVVAEPVRVLGLFDSGVEIHTRLAPGTPIVALGVDRLEPGQRVRVRP
ncbi:efflux RND transporter periplasmic adaptor subunit [Marichromatium gracile]|uniref:efflux RND transporter periplasmic adaptor subunit n=1 Tax=Marichromatium gracile TaxID=1048 RepID=UPI001F1F49EE|nr:efflux RND transporter periplasmic adaptor subunit [Marichromatium gracile]MCF1182066.1 efflux RND transporter periplasmic adaptor subunit [Marichromatium gracile]